MLNWKDWHKISEIGKPHQNNFQNTDQMIRTLIFFNLQWVNNSHYTKNFLICVFCLLVHIENFYFNITFLKGYSIFFLILIVTTFFKVASESIASLFINWASSVWYLVKTITSTPICIKSQYKQKYGKLNVRFIFV